MGTRETQSVDHMSEIINTASHGAGQIGGFISEQTRERPLVVGSIVVGAIGAIAGARIAQMQAMQRRRNAFERTMDTLGDFGAFITGWAMGRPKGPVDIVRERSQSMVGATRGFGGSMFGGMPMMGKSPSQPESVLKQVGYGLSLIPITLAFIRNPLVRDIGFRYLSRRLGGR